jgi:hypothetical protein
VTSQSGDLHQVDVARAFLTVLPADRRADFGRGDRRRDDWVRDDWVRDDRRCSVPDVAPSPAAWDAT